MRKGNQKRNYEKRKKKDVPQIWNFQKRNWCMLVQWKCNLNKYAKFEALKLTLLFYYNLQGTQRWAQTALAIVAFFGIEVTSDIPFSLQKKI